MQDLREAKAKIEIVELLEGRRRSAKQVSTGKMLESSFKLFTTKGDPDERLKGSNPRLVLR